MWADTSASRGAAAAAPRAPPPDAAAAPRPFFPASQGRAGSRQVTVSAKKLRVAINGFGRIGRQFLRCWEGRTDSNLEVVCVNDSGGVKQASHLLKYDSTMGTFAADVKVSRRGSSSGSGSGLPEIWVGTGGTCARPQQIRRRRRRQHASPLPASTAALPAGSALSLQRSDVNQSLDVLLLCR